MKCSNRLRHLISSVFSGIRKYRILLLTLSALVVFAVSYLLVLPALTLEKDEAAKQGGINLGSESVESSAGELSYEGKAYEVKVKYGEDAKIPEGATLKVTKIDTEDKEYAQIQKEVQKNLKKGKEDIPANPVLFDISIYKDGEEIEPAKDSQVQVDVELTGTLKGMYSDESSPLLINDKPATEKKAKIKKQMQILHLKGDDKIDVVEVEDKITDKKAVSSFNTDSFSNWLVYLDEDLTDINVTTGDSVTLRPYSEWVWKSTDEPSAYQGGQWVFPDSDWTPETYTENNVQYTEYTHKSNGSKFRSFKKTDDQLNETYTVVTSVSLNEGTFDIQTNKGKIIHVHVTQGESSPKPATVQGLPGLKVNLFDYDVPKDASDNYDFTKSGSLDDSANTASATGSQFYNASINNGHDLKFLGWGASNNSSTWINDYTNENPHQGIVKDRLGTDGYPVLNNGNNQGLQYLFDKESHDSNVYAFPSVGGLFQQDNQGFYYYNSNANYAEYNQSTNQFVLYEHTYSQNTGGSNGANAKPFGFFPFHEYDTGEDPQPSMNHNKNLNHHFGMSMTVDFMIPKDRKADASDGSKHDIIYEFSGDDDLWVFVDDELVLDIGGIHQPVAGTINFTTGEIIVHGVDNITKTFSVGGHTLKMFYMERGGCDSNLSIRFNLPLTLGQAELSVMKKSATDDEQEADQPLKKATFGIWENADCSGEPYLFGTSNDNGLVSFDKLPITEVGQVYYFKEIAPPPGYNLNSTIYVATAVGPDDNGDFSFNITNLDGTSPEMASGLTNTPIVRDSRPGSIALSVEKSWQNADGTEIADPTGTAVFKLKRRYTYVEMQPFNSILRVYRVDSRWGNPRLMVEREYAGDTTATVNWTYNQSLWDGYKNWQYRVDNGETQTKDADNPASVSLSAGTTTDFYIFDGNLGGQYEQYGVEDITVNGTPPSSSGGEIITGEGEDNEYQGPEITLPTSDGAWSDTFSGLVVMEARDNRTYYYQYYIVEKTVPEGFEVVYLDEENNPVSDPKDLATNENGSQKIVNRKLLDVPMDKQWPDFIDGSFTWEATFQLEQMEVKVNENDPDAEDAVTSFTPIDGKTLTIHKGQTPRPTFDDLPMYRTHSNGTVYRIQYSVSEIAYQVKQGDEVVAKWSQAGGLEVGSLYAPQFEQDAGEHGSEIGDYEIIVVNSLENVVISRSIELGLQKQWPGGSGIQNDPNAYARFILKRLVHEEYRDYSNVSEGTEWVDITLDTWGNGTKLQTVRVPKDTVLHIVGSIKGYTNANKIVMSQSSGQDPLELIKDNSGSKDKALFDITFTADQTKTISLTQGDNYVIGGRDGFFLSDTYGDKTVERVDPDFEVEINLNKDNEWKEHFNYLPQIVEQDVNPKETPQTVYVYSYYLEEVECNPENYGASYTDQDGTVLGDLNNGIDVDREITATNTRKLDVVIRKTDEDEHYLSGAVFKLEYRHDDSQPWLLVSKEKVPELNDNGEFTVPGTASGITLTSLEDGQYRIQEVTPPLGYIIIADYPVYFTVDHGNITGVDGTATNVRYDAATEEQKAMFTIPNTPGAELPFTGGHGTALFYILGSIFTLGAGMLFIRRRREA